MDGISDIVALLITSDSVNAPAMSDYDLPIVILLGKENGQFELSKRNDNIAYSSHYGDSTVLIADNDYFRLSNSSGKSGGYEYNYLFEYDDTKENWILAEITHCSYSGSNSQASIFTAEDLNFKYFDSELKLHSNLFDYIKVSFPNDLGYTNYLQLQFKNKAWKNKVNLLIATEHDLIHEYLKAHGCKGELFTTPLFISPDIICIEYMLSATVDSVDYHSGNIRYFTTIIDAKTGERLKLSDIVDINSLAQTLVEKGFYSQYGEHFNFSENISEIVEILRATDNIHTALENYGVGYFSGIQNNSFSLYWQPTVWVSGEKFPDYENITRYIPSEWIEPHLKIDPWEYEPKSGEFIHWKG